MLWRLRQFIVLWWHFFASGESKWGKVRKVIGLLIFLGIVPATLWGIVLTFCIPHETGCTWWSIRLGFLVAIIAGIGWGLVAAGRAYENSGIPELVIASDLIYDEGRFRFHLTSKKKDMDTKVWLTEILDTNGNRMLPGRLPIELEWTHHSGRGDVHLTNDIPESVSVAVIRFDEVTEQPMLLFTGATHKGHVKIADGEKAYFHLSIDYPKRGRVDRWFTFEKVAGEIPFRSIAESAPKLFPDSKKPE